MISTCGRAACPTPSSPGCAARPRSAGTTSPRRTPASGRSAATRTSSPPAGTPATFSSARGISFEEPTDEDMAARRTIIDTDPPDHTKLRKIVSGSFSQRAVAVYQHFVEGLTEQVLDGRAAPGQRYRVRLRGRGGQGGADPGAGPDHGPARGPPGPVHRPRRPAHRQHRPGRHRRGLGPGRHRRLPPVPVPQPVRQAAVGPRPRRGPGAGSGPPATTCCPPCCGRRWTATG